MERQECFLIDICGTIYRSNTTFDFMAFYFSAEPWFRRLQRVRKCRYISAVNSRIHYYFGIDIIRYVLIRHLKGYSRTELSSMVKTFYNDFLKCRVNEQVIEIIEKKRKEGYKLIIVSATLDCISKEIANRLNIPIQFSSTLSYDTKGICKGILQQDLLGNKGESLQSIGLVGRFEGVITDNYSDLDIIKLSRYAYLIQNANRNFFWSSLVQKSEIDYEYIIINEEQ